MELWIRSQDKETLMKANYFEIEQRDKNFLIMARDGSPYFDQCLGLYKTKERALEVLDEIQRILKPAIKAMTPITKIEEDYKTPNIKTELVGYQTEYDIIDLPTYVYIMPKE